MPEDAGLDIDFDSELAGLQAATAGIPAPVADAEVEITPGQIITSSRTVEFMGERFRISDKVGLMPLLKFSAYADMSTTDAGALGAMYAMLRDCIHQGTSGCGECESCQADNERGCRDFDPGDWGRFERHAMDVKAEADDLLDVITKAMELISGRPTGQPGPSSPGRRSTRDASMARSSARAHRGSRR